MKSWLSLFLVLAAPVALFAESNKSPKDSKAGKATASPTPETSSESKQDTMLKDIPAGQTYYGLRIPNFSPTGKLLMLFDAKAAKRITDRNLDMQDLKIEIHNDDGTTFHVSMSHSVFNLDTRILTSDTPTTISREDFVINGARAEFHLKNKFGRMLGPTTMTINSENVK